MPSSISLWRSPDHDACPTSVHGLCFVDLTRYASNIVATYSGGGVNGVMGVRPWWMAMRSCELLKVGRCQHCHSLKRPQVDVSSQHVAKPCDSQRSVCRSLCAESRSPSRACVVRARAGREGPPLIPWGQHTERRLRDRRGMAASGGGGSSLRCGGSVSTRQRLTCSVQLATCTRVCVCERERKSFPPHPSCTFPHSSLSPLVGACRSTLADACLSKLGQRSERGR